MKIINKTQAKRMLQKDEARYMKTGKFRFIETTLQPRVGPPIRAIVRFSNRSRKKNQVFAILSSK